MLFYLFYSVGLLIVFAVLLPIFIIAALLIVADSGFPVFYSHLRVGKNGRPFRLYKFRTMAIDADKIKNSLIVRNEADGPVFKIHDDPRFTPIGKFLSHTGLDELPQIINVLKGEMAIVGPRPLPVAEVAKMKKWHLARHAVKPGIISPWILEGYHRQSFDNWMRSDIDYIYKKSLGHDLVLTLRAVRLFFGLFWREIA